MQKFLIDYFKRAGKTLVNSNVEQLESIADVFMKARKQDKWIFAAGNGGSSATASHFANDFVKGLSVQGKKRFRVMCLNDSVPVLTALANDYSYADCFVEQLKNYAREGDIFVAYSGSGNSPNILKAAKYAKQIGMTVVSYTGRDGGKLNEYSHINCIAATNVMEEIEDVHMVWEHALVCALRPLIEKE